MKKLKYKNLSSKNRLYNVNCPIVGITGGIGSGKTLTSNFISSQKLNVICADTIVKEIYQKVETIDFIKKLSPQSVQKGEINFPALRKVFFEHKEKKEEIEHFIHPQIKNIFIKKVTPKDKIIFYDVPLLFEKKLQNKIDYSLLVTCSHSTQVKRVMGRDKITEELANSIISQQIPLKQKERECDYIIYNEDNLDSLYSKIQNFLNSITS